MYKSTFGTQRTTKLKITASKNSTMGTHNKLMGTPKYIQNKKKIIENIEWWNNSKPKSGVK